MKQHTIMFFSFVAAVMIVFSLCTTSCKKKSNNTSDSGTFYFHLHTQVVDSTIGGNIDGYDSNTTGAISTNRWFRDSIGRRIQLTIPQFFISNIVVVNANGTMYNMANMHILKGLDSEEYLIGKAPAGTYISAMFTVGLDAATNALPPTTLFLTDNNPFPFESSMWTGATTTGYYSMIVHGLYDTTAAQTGINPLPFNLEIPNSMTMASTVSLPTRGSASFPAYVLLSGGAQDIHVLCDYGWLLPAINLRTSNQTSVNSLIADSLANNIPKMFRYEQ